LINVPTLVGGKQKGRYTNETKKIRRSGCFRRVWDSEGSVTPPSEELQRAHEDYVQDLTIAWPRGAGNKEVVPNAHKASNNDAEPVQDMETMYRRYAEEISQAWKAPR